jgi:hypothetical protein
MSNQKCMQSVWEEVLSCRPCHGRINRTAIVSKLQSDIPFWNIMYLWTGE